MAGTEPEVDFIVTVQAVGEFSRLTEADRAAIQKRIDRARQIAEAALFAGVVADDERFNRLIGQFSTLLEGSSKPPSEPS